MEAERSLLVLSADEVRQLLHVDLAIASQRRAFAALGAGRAALPARLLVPGDEDAVAFCYAARLSPDSGAISKFGSVNPTNDSRGLPTVSALITVLDERTGRPVAIMEGTTVTTIRTAAATALALELLANPDPESLAIIGAGVQAAAHARAVSRVLPIRLVRIWSRTPDRREALAGVLDGELDGAVRATDTAEAAVRDADLVVTATTSLTPVIDANWVKPGATVVSIGSFAPDRCEVPGELLSRAGLIVVDEVEAAVEQAGPIVRGIATGVVTRSALTALGDVLVGVAPGRTDAGEIVFYNSVGLGVQDAAAALAVIPLAQAAGRGRLITL
jgi:ornithine cyclodeaminase